MSHVVRRTSHGIHKHERRLNFAGSGARAGGPLRSHVLPFGVMSNNVKLINVMIPISSSSSSSSSSSGSGSSSTSTSTSSGGSSRRMVMCIRMSCRIESTVTSGRPARVCPRVYIVGIGVGIGTGVGVGIGISICICIGIRI